MRDIDLTLRSDKAEGIPLLFLPSVLAFPGLADDLARNVVVEPIRDLAELLDRPDIGFFIELA